MTPASVSALLLGLSLLTITAGVVTNNVAVIVAGLPCAIAAIVVALWGEYQEQRS